MVDLYEEEEESQAFNLRKEKYAVCVCIFKTLKFF